MNVINNISLTEKEYTVNVYDLDMNVSSTMMLICNFMQDIGITHGMLITKDAGINNSDIIFVLTRLHVKLDRLPDWHEKIKIESWLSPIKDKYVIRNFELSDSSGKTIGRGINSAVSFSMKERTGVTLDLDANRVQTLDREPALPHNFEKLTEVEKAEHEMSHTVRYFDCDLYRHVNNVKYIQWCAEALPFDFLKNHTLHEIDINFRAEANFGDTVISKAAKGPEGGVFHHAITNITGTKDLVRMKSVWKSR
ncbi:MAG TPA: thioesterase [Spirochaetota bacterium]|nr:thioesterase [Spirochaetota bacterium]